MMVLRKDHMTVAVICFLHIFLIHLCLGRSDIPSPNRLEGTSTLSFCRICGSFGFSYSFVMFGGAVHFYCGLFSALVLHHLLQQWSSNNSFCLLFFVLPYCFDFWLYILLTTLALSTIVDHADFRCWLMNYIGFYMLYWLDCGSTHFTLSSGDEICFLSSSILLPACYWLLSPSLLKYLDCALLSTGLPSNFRFGILTNFSFCWPTLDVQDIAYTDLGLRKST